MIDVMWSWFSKHLPSDGSVVMENLSSATSIMALQGPNAKQILDGAMGEGQHVGRFKWRALTENTLGTSGWIQGTGYTGEAGYEIFVPNEEAAPLWRALVANGATPVGLGARDTLRLEKGYLLSGVDFCSPSLSEDDDGFLARDSWETNVPFGLDLNHEFIGKQRVLGHDPTDERWWGQIPEKGPLPRPEKMTSLTASPSAAFHRVRPRQALTTPASVSAIWPTSRKATRCWSLPVLGNRCGPSSFVHRFTESWQRLRSWHPANAGVHAHRWPSIQPPGP